MTAKLLNRSRTRRRTIKLIALALFILVGAASLIFLYLRFKKEKPKKDVAGWNAVVTTFAGTGAPAFADGQASAAQFADPFGITIDRDGNLYVADAGNNNRIRKITPAGIVSTLAGGQEGFTDGQGAAASFNTPSGLAIDAAGNLYVADTGNNAIRKVTPQGVVTTIAGDGAAGSRDGAATGAQFNGPIGVAVDASGVVYIADTYNDRIRKLTTDGQVTTIAGGATNGFQDGPAASTLFDTPSAIAVNSAGTLFIADTGNDAIRRLTTDGQVTTFAGRTAETNGDGTLRAPIALALTPDDFLYVTENASGRVSQISPEGTVRALTGGGRGFNNGSGSIARFNSPAGITLDQKDNLFVADASNYLIRKLSSTENAQTENAPNEVARDTNTQLAQSVQNNEPLPRLSAEILGINSLSWPIDPQQSAHEVVATMGEVRGSYEGESRDHLHSGIDVQGAYGALVRSIYDEKVTGVLSDWGYGNLSEGVRIGVMTYVHVQVGRNQKDELLDKSRFTLLRNTEGKAERVRIKRGTRFHVGDVVGTINKMYHVHLNFGPGSAELNPLALPFVGFKDTVAPQIEHDGVQLFNQAGERLTAQRNKRLLVQGDVSIVVDAFDQNDGNAERRRLGLYKLGYQILNPDGTPAQGFSEPRINIEFNRLPSDAAVKVIYAEGSGITVYGNKTTRFLYVVTNTVRDGRVSTGTWHSSELAHGDYILRIFAADYSGNEAKDGRDLPITIE